MDMNLFEYTRMPTIKGCTPDSVGLSIYHERLNKCRIYIIEQADMKNSMYRYVGGTAWE